MAQNSRLTKETYVLMGARLEAHVEHRLKAWIYLHDRIVQALTRKILYRTLRNSQCLAGPPNTDLLGLPERVKWIALGMATDSDESSDYPNSGYETEQRLGL
jgi:hypothetical protein